MSYSICIIQQAGAHAANKKFRECLSLKRAFEFLGHTAIAWGHGHNNFDKIPDWEQFDIILMIENYSTQWVPDLSKTKHPFKFVWSIDSHVMDVHPHAKIFREGNYDIFLQSTGMFVDRVENSVWFPNAYDHFLISPPKTPKKDVFMGFCGSQLNRVEMCSKIAGKYPFSADYWVLGDAMVQKVQSYEIGFNRNMNWDINYRNFEVMGAGTCLFTNNDMNTKDYKELGFVDMQNCVLYNSEDISGMMEKIDYLYNNRDIIKKIAKAGHKFVYENHRYVDRAKFIIQLVNKGKK